MQPKQILAGVTFLCVLFVFSIVGIIAGAWCSSFSAAKYQSRSIFQIAPEWVAGNQIPAATVEKLVEICELPHDELICERESIRACLVKNQLFVLDCFSGLGQTQALEYVAKNVEVRSLTENAENGIAYEVVLTTSNAQDTATILNNLVNHYPDKLRADYPGMQPHYAFKLLQHARIGKYSSPNRLAYISLGVCGGVFLAAALWFLINPFRLKLRPISFIQLISALLILVICVSAGSVIGDWVNGKTMFICSAQFSIADNIAEHEREQSGLAKRLAALAREPHELMISQFKFIDRVLHKNGLYDLSIFRRGKGSHDVIEMVQQNMEVVVDPEGRYTITFRAENADDCQQVVEALTKTYVKELEQRNLNALYGEIAPRVTQVKQKVSGIPRLFEAEMVGPPSASSGTTFVAGVPVNMEWLVGMSSRLFGLVICLAWFATRDNQLEQDGDNAPLT